EQGVVGKFVEFYGEGVSEVPLANRATIGNMSPEFGSTAAMFPIDEVTLDYLRLTGRSEEQVALVEKYTKEQGLWHDPSQEVAYSEYLELDLSTVVPSIAGPKRPQDRIELTKAKEQFRSDLTNYVHEDVSEQEKESFPASDAPSHSATAEQEEQERPRPTVSAAAGAEGRASDPIEVSMPDGREFEMDHGAVAIASITSCTNTSNPSVMMAAGVLARNAAAKGLTSKPWVKTSIAPGSKVVTDYYEKAGLLPDLEKVGFYVVGYGCTTCIGNSGPLEDEVSQAVNEKDLSVTSVLSGNRNFEGRINPDVKMNYLASPPLVIAYALAGS
ncbi:aconitate hydratase, partial [Amycolatopsis sp. H6(2020)]|nr:aconitate hydratase [Amycolatopsis sp. H6(2020)]